MKKTLILTCFLLVLFSVSVQALQVNENVTFTPSATSATYQFKENATLSSLEVTSTQLLTDRGDFSYTTGTHYLYDFRFTAIDGSTGAAVNSFNVSLNGLNTTTNGTAKILISNGTYTGTADAGGYASVSFNITASGADDSQVLTFWAANSVQINIYDEETGAALNGTDVFLTISSDDYFNTSTINESTDFISALPPDSYVLKYNGSTYGTKYYYVTIVADSYTNISLYLSQLNDDATLVNVYNLLGQSLEGARVKLLRKVTGSDPYIMVTMAETNADGLAYMLAKRYDEIYIFYIEYQGELKKVTTAAPITSETLNFFIDTGEIVKTNTEKLLNITSTIVNTSDSITYTFNDANNIISQGCLYLYERGDAQNTLISQNCSASVASSVNLKIPSLSKSYLADGVVTWSGTSYLMRSKELNNNGISLDIRGGGALFLFLLLLMTGTALGMMVSVPIGFIIGALMMFVGGWVSILPLATAATLGIVGLIVAVIVGVRD